MKFDPASKKITAKIATITICFERSGDKTIFISHLQIIVCDEEGKGPFMLVTQIIEPRHEISNNAVCATSKASDQPAHMRSLIRAFASRLNIL